jgi:hypothetical protein
MSSISRLAPAGLALGDLSAADPAGDGLLRLAGNADLLHVGESVPVPEPLADSVAGLLPEPASGLLHAVPLLALYRFDPNWRRDTLEATLRLQALVLTAHMPHVHATPPDTPAVCDARAELRIERGKRPAGEEPDRSGSNGRPAEDRPGTASDAAQRPTN